VGRLSGAGIRVTVGRLRSFHHYTVIDDIDVVTSLKDRTGVPTSTGSRRARVSLGNRELARAVVLYDDFLTRAAKSKSEKSGAPLSDLLDTLAESPLMARYIPLGENMLVLGGMAEEEARRFVREAKEKIDRSFAEGDLPVGPMTETALVNETCLRTATLL